MLFGRIIVSCLFDNGGMTPAQDYRQLLILLRGVAGSVLLYIHFAIAAVDCKKLCPLLYLDCGIPVPVLFDFGGKRPAAGLCLFGGVSDAGLI